MSCSGDLVRVPFPEYAVPIEFSKGFGYNNGGFILRKSDERLHYLLDKLARNNGGVVPDYTPIPCGKCLECRLEYSKQWAQRLVCESTLYENNWFITLTYDDDHLIDNVEYTVSPWTHTMEYVATLRKDDFTSWKKRFLEKMRYKFGVTGIRFYMCGEYGEKNHRPHFHAILFNCPFPDLKLEKNVSLGGYNYCYYSSKLLSESWGKGFVMIGSVNWNTCSYVARYVMKKMYKSDATLYENLCDLEGVKPIQSEFVNMSRRPGIAREYYNKNWREIYNVDKVVLPDGKSCKPARYFDKLFDIESHSDLERLKSDRVRRAQLKHVNLNKYLSPEQITEKNSKKHEALVRGISRLKRNI